MIHNVFVTGDRSVPHEIAVLPVSMVLLEELAKTNSAAEQLCVWTGDNKGVEHAVRVVCESISLPLVVIETPLLEDGRPDWTARADKLAAKAELRVIALHGAPEASSMLKPMLEQAWDDRLTLLTA